MCLNGRHKACDPSVLKTNIQQDGRGTIFTACENSPYLKVQGPPRETSQAMDFMVENVFYTDRYDNKIGNSVEDRGSIWMLEVIGLRHYPSRVSIQALRKKKSQVYKRSNQLRPTFEKNPNKLSQMCEYMKDIFDTGAAERAPELQENISPGTSPIFGVMHPRKPGKVRAVFDSSVVFQGCSLNDALLSGPNLTKNLLGVWLRFRKDLYAIAGDIQQMFYRFHVNEEDRVYLRFFWYDNNNPQQSMVEYRMTVHIFGNRLSPAVATYGLRRVVQDADPDVFKFCTPGL